MKNSPVGESLGAFGSGMEPSSSNRYSKTLHMLSVFLLGLDTLYRCHTSEEPRCLYPTPQRSRNAHPLCLSEIVCVCVCTML